MEPPVHLRVVSRSDYLIGVVVRVIPLLLFIGGATTYLILLSRRDDHTPVEVLSLCGLVGFGIFAIGLVLPHLGRRIRGFAELRSASAGVLAANQLIEAGRPVEAAAKYDTI